MLPPAQKDSRSFRKSRFIWILILLAGFATVVPQFITVNILRDVIAVSLSQHLGRNVSVGEIHFTLWNGPGLEIANVAIADLPEFGPEPILRMEFLRATPSLISIWKGRIEFSSLEFVRPSLNLVRDQNGKWNIGAGRMVSASPEVTSEVEPERFLQDLPRFQVSSGRINFKFNHTKTAFFLSEVDLSLKPAASANEPWQMQFEATPSRSDIQFFPASRIQGTAEFSPPPARLQQAAGIPLRLELTADSAQLSDLVQVVFGSDPGVRGNLHFDSLLTGTTSLLRFSARADFSELHRWDLPPGSKDDLFTTAMAGVIDLSQASLNLQANTKLAGDGQLVISSQMDSIFSQSEPSLLWNIKRVPVKSLLQLSQKFTPHLDRMPLVSGTVEGTVSMSVKPFVMDGTLQVSDVVIAKNEAARRFIFSDFPLSIHSHDINFGPMITTMGENGTLSATIFWNTQSAESRTAIRGDHLPIADFMDLVVALGGPQGNLKSVAGDLALNVSVVGARERPIQANGSAQLSNAAFQFDSSNERLVVHSARLLLQDSQVRLNNLKVTAGHTDFSGSLVVSMPTQFFSVQEAVDHKPWQVQFNLNSPIIDIADMEILLHNRLEGAGNSASLNLNNENNSLYFLHNIVAIGKLQADELKYHNLSMSNVQTALSYSNRILTINDFTGVLAGGVHSGKMSVQFGPVHPFLSIESQFRNLDVSQLSSWIPSLPPSMSGKLSGRLRLAGGGLTKADFLDKLGGSGTIESGNLDMDISSQTTGLDSFPDNRLFIDSLTATFQIMRREIILNDSQLSITIPNLTVDNLPGGNYDWTVTGSIGFDKQLNLLARPEFGSQEYRWAGSLLAPQLTQTVSSLLP